MRIFRTHLRSRSVALAHPEVSIRGLAVVGEVGDEEGLGINNYHPAIGRVTNTTLRFVDATTESTTYNVLND